MIGARQILPLTVAMLCVLHSIVAAQETGGPTSLVENHAEEWVADVGGDVRVLLPVGGGSGGPTSAILVVSSTNGLTALSATTGSAEWTRPDLSGLRDDRIQHMLGYDQLLIENDSVFAVSLQDGRTVWSEHELPLSDVRAVHPVPGSNRLLLTGRDAAGNKATTLINSDSGELDWIRSDHSNRDPETRRGVRSIAQSDYLPPLLRDSDTTFISFLTKDGPTRIDLRSGSVVWRTEGLDSDEPPVLPAPDRTGDRWAQWELIDDRVYLPYEDRVAVIHIEDGRVLWDKDVGFPVGGFVLLDSTLVLQGWKGRDSNLHLNRVRAADGVSVWDDEPDDLKYGLSPVLDGPRMVTVGDGRVWTVDLGTGALAEVAELDLDAGEHAMLLESSEHGFAVISPSNFVSLSREGHIVGTSFFDNDAKKAGRIASMINRVAVVASTITVGRAAWNLRGASPEIGGRVDEMIQSNSDFMRRVQEQDRAFVRQVIDGTLLGPEHVFYPVERAGEKVLLLVEKSTGKEVGSVTLREAPSDMALLPSERTVFLVYSDGVVTGHRY